MNEIVKIANNQLNRTPDYQVVKVAGILRRLKNWLKSKFDSEFENQVRQLESESAEYSVFLEQLAEQVAKVQLAIKDKELEEYRTELVILKDLLNQGSEAVSSSIADTNKLEESITKFFEKYTSKLHKDTEYRNKVENFLKKEKGYDVPLNQPINEKFKDTDFYKDLQPSDVHYTNEAFLAFLKILTKAASYKKINIPRESISKEVILPILQNSIINGTINSAKLYEQSQHNIPNTGTLELNVDSDYFKIPNTDLMVTINFKIRDESTAMNSASKKLIVAWHNKITINKTSNARVNKYYSLIKEALQPQERPYQINNLSDLQFANALLQGYQLAFNKMPTLQILAFGWAQAALESGRPFKLPQNNVGNIKASEDWIKSGKPYFRKSTEEFTDKGKKFIHSNAAWRAYNSPEEGAAGYWKLVASRFPDALEWAAAGDPQSAGVSLGLKTYYTARIDKYSGSLKSLYQTFLDNYADDFSNLSNEAIPSSKIKPAVKQWKTDYSKDEIESYKAKATKSPEQIRQDEYQEEEHISDITDDKIDSLLGDLMTDLFSSSSNYYNRVKNALLKSFIPKNNIFIKVEGSDEVDNLEYAKNLNYLIQDYLSGQTSIHKENANIYIQASIQTNNDARQGVIELSDLLTKEINAKINKNVYTIVANDIVTAAPIIDNEEIKSNHRKFLMRYS